MARTVYRRLWCYGAALLLCLAVTAPAGAGAMPLRPGLSGQDTNPWTTVLRDPTGQLTIDQVRAAPYAGRFHPFYKGRAHLGVASGACWLRLEVKNISPASHTWLLQPTHPQFDQVSMFFFPASGQAASFHLGDHLPFAQRPIPHQTSLFPLKLGPGQSAVVYVRLAYVDAGIADVRLRIWSPKPFSHAQAAHVAAMGLMIGGYLMIALFNLFIAFSTRAQEYVWYVLYVLAVAITSLAYQGLGYRFLWHGWGWFTDNAPVVFPILGLALAAQFTRSFLKLKQTMPRMDKVLKGYIVFTLVLMAGLFLGFRREAIIISICISSIGLVFPLLGLNLWLKGRREARYYTVAWTFWMVATTLVILRYFGLIRQDFFTGIMPSVFMLVEALLLSLALTDRIKLLREQKERAEKSYLNALRQDKLELERQVRERTAEIECMHRQAVRASRTDMLTGLPNRRAFYEEAGRELGRAARYRRMVSLIMLDIDLFKSINDTHGHAAGDEVLRHLAGILSLEKRSHDLMGRLGGEEFGLVLPEATPDEAVALAERIRQVVATSPATYNGVDIDYSASFGVTRQMPGDSIETILNRADEALYLAKAAGRNRVEVA